MTNWEIGSLENWEYTRVPISHVRIGNKHVTNWKIGSLENWEYAREPFHFFALRG